MSVQPETKKDKVVPDNVRGFLAGTASGISKLVTGHPLDTIKVRLQIEGSYGRFKGPLDCLATTWRQEGIRGLYKGATPPLIGWSAIDTLMIGTYHTVRRQFMAHHEEVYKRKVNEIIRLQSHPGSTGLQLPRIDDLKIEPLKLWEIAVSGTAAGWASCLLVTPFEQVKARLQVQYADPTTVKYKGPIDCVRSLVRNNGIRGLYWGFWATFSFRSFIGFYFASYEFFKSYVERVSLPLPVQSLVCGGAAATSLWLIAYPTDVIYETEGIKGFYKGFTPCLIRSIPANGSAFLAMELVLNHLP